MTSLLKCFNPCCRREPTVWQSRSVYLVSTNQQDSPDKNCVNSLVSHPVYEPHSLYWILKCIYKAIVGVRFINGAKLLFGTACNPIVERVLPTRNFLLTVTWHLNSYWLRVYFVLGASPGFSEMKPAVGSSDGVHSISINRFVLSCCEMPWRRWSTWNT